MLLGRVAQVEMVAQATEELEALGELQHLQEQPALQAVAAASVHTEVIQGYHLKAGTMEALLPLQDTVEQAVTVTLDKLTLSTGYRR
jgi:hypothetical protein